MTTTSLDDLRVDKLPSDQQDLYRVWAPPSSDWEPNPLSGKGRVDCPMSPAEYSMLYMSTTALVAVQETFVLTADNAGWIFHRGRAEHFNITAYRTTVPLAAATLDEPNASLLGLTAVTLLDGYGPYRAAALKVWRSRRPDIHALYWHSKHREASGNVVAVFHELKGPAGLRRVSTIKLLDHPVAGAIQKSARVLIK